MRVLIAGATGAMGLPLVHQLVAGGHEVIGLTRSPAKQQMLTQAGATAVVADALDREGLTQAVRHAAPTHVVHMLTALPKNGPLRAADVTATNTLRIEGTRNLLQAAIAAGAQRIVGESLIFAYGLGDLGSVAKTEADALQVREPHPSLQPIVDAVRVLEDQLLQANGQGQIEAIPLRYGGTYGPENPSTLYMLRMVRRRLLPLVRSNGLTSLIHTFDAAAATIAALTVGKPGEIYNIVDDEPVNFNDLFTLMAQMSGAPPPFFVPRWLMGALAPYLLTVLSTRLPVSNAKAKQHLHWTPRFPTYREGLQQILGKA